MKKFALSTVAALGLLAAASVAHADGIKIGQFQANTAPIIGGQLIGKVKVGSAAQDVDVGNTAVANTLDIDVEGQKVDKIGTAQGNSGIVVAVQAIGKVQVDGAKNVSVKNLAAGNAGAIKITK